MARNRSIRRHLAQVAAGTPWTYDDLAGALAGAISGLVVDAPGRRITRARRERAAAGLSAAVLRELATSIAPSLKRIDRALSCTAFYANGDLWEKLREPPVAVIAEHSFAPLRVFANLELPALDSAAALANFLDCPPEQLDWFAGLPQFRPQGSMGSLLHYRFSFHPKASGGLRLIEMPKPRLKHMQRRILHEILDRVPPHAAAHGFTRGRSPVTAASVHAGEALVIATDVADFFPSIPVGRVHGLFRSLGYPPAVATRLAGLTTTATPEEVFRDLPREERPEFRQRRMFTSPHLPQGAPTSPTLANLVAYRLDLRLDGLARRYGLTYTRYADDLAFSGDRLNWAAVMKFLALVSAIAADEAFDIRPTKTRVMPTAGAQRLLGLSVNSHVNIPREDYDRLKAVLTNCRRFGAMSQNRDGHADFRSHLDGRIGWVEHVNRQRGLKLRALFDAIIWP